MGVDQPADGDLVFAIRKIPGLVSAIFWLCFRFGVAPASRALTWHSRRLSITLLLPNGSILLDALSSFSVFRASHLASPPLIYGSLRHPLTFPFYRYGPLAAVEGPLPTFSSSLSTGKPAPPAGPGEPVPPQAVPPSPTICSFPQAPLIAPFAHFQLPTYSSYGKRPERQRRAGLRPSRL
jgi:hypothetical protein